MANPIIRECIATFDVVAHSDHPDRLRHIIGKVTHPTTGEVANLQGFIISPRWQWKQCGDFIATMDDESDEMMHFSADLFDDNTNVHPWLIDGSHRSGSGCWGQELNKDAIVYLENLTVKDKFLRSGVGSWFLSEFMKYPHVLDKYDPGHVYCWPTPGPGASQLVDQESVTRFFQKNGFRRVGRTNFLCYSFDADHPSRALAVGDDPAPLPQEYKNRPILTDDEWKAQYPLHYSISADQVSGVVDTIKAAFSIDPAIIHKPDPAGLTPVHTAAQSANVDALRTLLELGVSEDLKNTRNASGETPLEALRSRMRSKRDAEQLILGTWGGYTDNELICEYLLKKATAMRISEVSEPDYIKKRKLGCTCEQCTDGWLSPRMRYRLSTAAILHYDNNSLSQWSEMHANRGRRLTQDFLEDPSWSDDEYLPPAILSRVTKRFRNSWYSLFRSIHDILESPERQIPTVHRLGSNRDAYEFLARGGKPEYAIDAATSMAKDTSPLGDGSFIEKDHESYGKLPACENDLAFDLVRMKLGLDPRESWAPYSNGFSGYDDDSD